MRFLLDANLSPETGKYLRETFGFDVIDLISEKKVYLPDEEVAVFAKNEKRIIITFDLDFGEIYHFKEKGKPGIIVLRLRDQTVESVNKALYRFFTTEAKTIKLGSSLVLVEEERIRID